MNKRNFLKVSSMCSLGLGAVLTFSYFNSAPTTPIIAVLRRRLKGLNVMDKDLEKFAAEYVETRGEYKYRLRILGIFGIPLQFLSPYNIVSLNSPFRRFEDNVVSVFLLSTNFFRNGAKPSEKIRYEGLYDPYRSPCLHPLSTEVK